MSDLDQNHRPAGPPDDSLDRVDGRLKVTGAARYAAEYQPPQLVHAVLVCSTIARGRITALDTRPAEGAPGVLGVITHLNSPGVPGYGSPAKPAERASLGQPLRVFFDEHVYFSGQPVGLVVADTLERAQYAASLVKVQYASEAHQTSLLDNLHRADLPSGAKRNPNSPYNDYVRGNPGAVQESAVQVEAVYVIPTEHHNPMEPHATIAVWEAEDKLTIYDKNHSVRGTHTALAQAFKLPEEHVRVEAQFVGGGFGSGLRMWPNVIAAALAAKKVKRPVKMVLTREQMFTSVGYRPFSRQHLRLGATPDGQLTALSHEAIAQTSSYEEFTDRTVQASKLLYACPNVSTRYRIVPLDVNTPTWMRGPGESTGVFALECAMDELAYALKMDPLALRLRNYADTDPLSNLPWSGKHLRECYRLGAERFGWYQRNPEPRSMRAGRQLVGYGLASSVFGAQRTGARARARLLADGSLVVQSATSDNGPGTATAMVRIAAETLQLDPARIRFDLGRSVLPQSPSQSGSTTVSSVGSAVQAACLAMRQKLVQLATATSGAPTYQAPPENLRVEQGHVVLAGTPAARISFAELLRQNNLPELEVLEESKPGEERSQYSMHSFGAHFVEVQVDPATGEVRVTRAVAAADVGRIINPKTARSQAIGGVIGGIGMALMEESVMDHRYGRYLTANFADYHVPVHADAPQIDPVFTNISDPHINPLGSRGLGEISIVGVAAAVANAVFHATGKRVRELPITPDKVL
ncbi:molybdopterin-dependent oxidoreductase [soil metagenome]